jgi:hypothetical protein
MTRSNVVAQDPTAYLAELCSRLPILACISFAMTAPLEQFAQRSLRLAAALRIFCCLGTGLALFAAGRLWPKAQKTLQALGLGIGALLAAGCAISGSITQYHGWNLAGLAFACGLLGRTILFVLRVASAVDRASRPFQ